MIGRRNFDGCGQVEDDLLEMIGYSFTSSLFDSLADLERKLGFRLRERFWAVLEGELGAVRLGYFVCELAEVLRMSTGEGDSLLLGVLENYGAEERRGGVVHVDDGMLAAGHGFDGTFDQVFTRGRQNLGSLPVTITEHNKPLLHPD